MQDSFLMVLALLAAGLIVLWWVDLRAVRAGRRARQEHEALQEAELQRHRATALSRRELDRHAMPTGQSQSLASRGQPGHTTKSRPIHERTSASGDRRNGGVAWDLVPEVSDHATGTSTMSVSSPSRSCSGSSNSGGYSTGGYDSGSSSSDGGGGGGCD